LQDKETIGAIDDIIVAPNMAIFYAILIAGNP